MFIPSRFNDLISFLFCSFIYISRVTFFSSLPYSCPCAHISLYICIYPFTLVLFFSLSLTTPVIYSPLEVDDFRYFSSAVSSKQVPLPKLQQSQRFVLIFHTSVLFPLIVLFPLYLLLFFSFVHNDWPSCSTQFVYTEIYLYMRIIDRNVDDDLDIYLSITTLTVSSHQLGRKIF